MTQREETSAFLCSETALSEEICLFCFQFRHRSKCLDKKSRLSATPYKPQVLLLSTPLGPPDSSRKTGHWAWYKWGHTLRPRKPSLGELEKWSLASCGWFLPPSFTSAQHTPRWPPHRTSAPVSLVTTATGKLRTSEKQGKPSELKIPKGASSKQKTLWCAASCQPRKFKTPRCP